MAGYPRVIGGYVAGGYVAGAYPGTGIYGQPPPQPMLPPPQGYGQPGYGHHPHHHQYMLPPELHPHSPPWRPMVAPGSPPVGEGHVPMPLNAEEFNGRVFRERVEHAHCIGPATDAGDDSVWQSSSQLFHL